MFEKVNSRLREYSFGTKKLLPRDFFSRLLRESRKFRVTVFQSVKSSQIVNSPSYFHKFVSSPQSDASKFQKKFFQSSKISNKRILIVLMN